MSGSPVPDALALAGSLTLVVGAPSPIQGGRPVLSPGWLDRLASQCSIDQWPEQLGRLFSLCGHAQTLASHLALQGCGATETSGQMTARTGVLLRVVTAREQLQRMVLDWPWACSWPWGSPTGPIWRGRWRTTSMTPACSRPPRQSSPAWRLEASPWALGSTVSPSRQNDG